MVQFPLFKTKTVVVQIVCILTIAFGLQNLATAQNGDSDGDSDGNRYIMMGGGPAGPADPCSTAARELDEAENGSAICDIGSAAAPGGKGAAKSASDATKCIEQVQGCNGADMDLGETILDTDDDPPEPSDLCNSIKDQIKKYGQECVFKRSESPEDLRRDREEADDDIRDTLKRCDDLSKQVSEAATKNADAQDKNSDNQIKSQKDYNQQMLDITKQMRDALTGMNDDNSKMAAEGMKKSDDLRQNALKLQEELARKVDKKNNTYVQWQTACLAAAEDARQSVEDAYQKYLDQIAKQKKNYSFNSLAGLKLRLLKQSIKKRELAYNQMKGKCLNGTKGPGIELKVKFDQDSRDVNTSTVTYQNQMKELQRQDQMNQYLMQQEKQNNYQKYTQAMQDLQQRQQQLMSDHQQDMMNDQMKAARDAQAQSQNDAQTKKDYDNCANELDSDKKLKAAALAKMNCLGSGSNGHTSDSKGLDDTSLAIKKFRNACRDIGDCSPNSKGKIADYCTQMLTKINTENMCNTLGNHVPQLSLTTYPTAFASRDAWTSNNCPGTMPAFVPANNASGDNAPVAPVVSTPAAAPAAADAAPVPSLPDVSVPASMGPSGTTPPNTPSRNSNLPQ